MKRALLLLLIAVLGACSSDAEPTAPSSSSSTPAAPEIVNGEPCPPAPHGLDLPDDAGCASSTAGAFEAGDSKQELVVYADLDDADLPTRWHMRLIRSDGEVLDAVVEIGSKASYPVVLGAEDADQEGLDEAFVKALSHQYHSGATHEVSIFGVRDGRFFRVRTDEGPLVFQVSGVSVFGEGAECRDVDADGEPEFLLLRIDGVTNDVQSWSERTYRWEDRSLIFVRRREGVMAKTGYSDPLLLRYYSLRCFEFEPPYPYARG